MTLRELFRHFRSEVDDIVKPYLWTDDDLDIYFNMALEKLAKDALYFYDTTTWSALPVTAADPQILVTSNNKLGKLWRIDRAKLTSQTSRDLKVCTMSQAGTVVSEDDYGARTSFSWEATSGTPRVIITDYYGDGSLRLGPIPGDADTLSLWAFRLPLEFYTLKGCADDDLRTRVGLRELSHELAVIEGMKWRAYLKEDPETRDTEISTRALVLFTSQLSDIKEDDLRRRKPAGVTRYGGL